METIQELQINCWMALTEHVMICTFGLHPLQKGKNIKFLSICLKNKRFR